MRTGRNPDNKLNTKQQNTGTPDRQRPEPNRAYRSAAPYTPAPRKNNSVHLPYPPTEMQRRKQLMQIRKKKRRQKICFLVIVCICFLLLIIGLVVLVVKTIFRRPAEPSDPSNSDVWDTVSAETESRSTVTTDSVPPIYSEPNAIEASTVIPRIDSRTVALNDEVSCPYALLMNCNTGIIMAEKNSSETIFPASMTKLMTVLVAYENLSDLDATFRMTNEIIDPLYLASLALAGFAGNEDVQIRDLFYGCALPSGAEASVALAIAAGGSEEAFVEKMNERAASLGMTGTHFVNCTGMHDEQHYSTPADIAILMRYVMENDDLRTIFSTYQHTTAPTPQHPEGLLLTSTLFSRMDGSESLVCTVVGGKTGYTIQAQQCLATYAIRNDTGEPYVCVVAGGETKWRPIYDSIYLYQYYTES